MNHVSVCVSGSRDYRAGVERGWTRADRMFIQDGAAILPVREDAFDGAPYWVSDSESYLDGFAVGFARRVSGQWPNGVVRG